MSNTKKSIISIARVCALVVALALVILAVVLIQRLGGPAAANAGTQSTTPPQTGVTLYTEPIKVNSGGIPVALIKT